jgi:hypothetical protein
MHATGTTAAITAGKWGTTVKTVAMGAAGTALWGSLAFYFVAGMNGAEAVVEATTAERLFFRMELAETELVEGCALNNGEGICDGQAWIILSEHKPRVETPDIPGALSQTVPLPLWEEVAARNSMSDSACNKTVTEGLPAWLASMPKAETGLTVALLPAAMSSCQATAPGIDPQREHRNYWFLSGDKVVAELRCSLPGTYMEPSCELAAFPQHGRYEASYSRIPAANVETMIYQTPHMLAVLKEALPSEAALTVDLGFMTGPFSVDGVTAASLAELKGVTS